MGNDNIGYMLNIAGKPTKLVVDINAMSDIEQTLELMKGGMVKKNFFQLIDPPYDIREECIIVMHGINGAYRQEGSDKRVSLQDVQQLITDHFKFMADKVLNDPDIPKNQKDQSYGREHGTFMKELSKAIRHGLGYNTPEDEEKNPEATAPTAP